MMRVSNVSCMYGFISVGLIGMDLDLLVIDVRGPLPGENIFMEVFDFKVLI